MFPVSFPPGLPMATSAALRGQRMAEARAADAAARIVLSGTAPNHALSRTLVQAQEAAPDALRGLTDLHQATLAYKANAATLRGANAAAASLLRWSA